MHLCRCLCVLLLAVLGCQASAQQPIPHAASVQGEADIVPAVIGKVMPLFFQRASKVVIQLVRDKLSSVRLGDLETYADGGALERSPPPVRGCHRETFKTSSQFSSSPGCIHTRAPGYGPAWAPCIRGALLHDHTACMCNSASQHSEHAQRAVAPHTMMQLRAAARSAGAGPVPGGPERHHARGAGPVEGQIWPRARGGRGVPAERGPAEGQCERALHLPAHHLPAGDQRFPAPFPINPRTCCSYLSAFL